LAKISESLKQKAKARADWRCEYCLLHQDDAPQRHEVDHIIAIKHRGKTILDNLVCACFPCNRHKGTDLATFDPESQTLTTLYNPRIHIWHEHFTLEDGRIIGLTVIGRATAELLKFNLPMRVGARQQLIERGRYPLPE
jgi:hypothetical protein